MPPISPLDTPWRASFILGAATGLALPAQATELNLDLELPRLPVAEYHRPYVAMWLEHAADGSLAGQLAVWYDVKKRDNGGSKWLKDLRQWWRKSGRELQMPVDGISGATRAPGPQRVVLGGAEALKALPAGAYHLVIEAARENGGRELLRLPFQWPPQAAQRSRAQGEHELGAATLELKP